MLNMKSLRGNSSQERGVDKDQGSENPTELEETVNVSLRLQEVKKTISMIRNHIQQTSNSSSSIFSF